MHAHARLQECAANIAEEADRPRDERILLDDRRRRHVLHPIREDRGVAVPPDEGAKLHHRDEAGEVGDLGLGVTAVLEAGEIEELRCGGGRAQRPPLRSSSVVCARAWTGTVSTGRSMVVVPKLVAQVGAWSRKSQGCCSVKPGVQSARLPRRVGVSVGSIGKGVSAQCAMHSALLIDSAQHACSRGTLELRAEGSRRLWAVVSGGVRRRVGRATRTRGQRSREGVASRDVRV